MGGIRYLLLKKKCKFAGGGGMIWISVDDRLPDNDNKVIVFWDGGDIDILQYESKPNAEWVGHPDNYGDYSYVPPTHWMPLPDPTEVVE